MYRVVASKRAGLVFLDAYGPGVDDMNSVCLDRLNKRDEANTLKKLLYAAYAAGFDEGVMYQADIT